MTQVQNLTTNTMTIVRSTKKDFINAMNNRTNTEIKLCDRTDNGWYVMTVNGVKMILEISEII